MAVLLIAEHNNKELRPFTLNAATAASQIDSDVHAVIIGQNSADAAKQLSELPVVKKVLSVEGAHYENFTAENFAPVIVKLAENYSHIVCSANTFGKKKEKKLNLIDLNLEQQELLYQVAEECKVGTILN